MCPWRLIGERVQVAVSGDRVRVRHGRIVVCRRVTKAVSGGTVRSQSSVLPVAKDDRKRVTRQKVLDAALDLFGTHGYERTTVADIALKANVGKGTVFLHSWADDLRR